MQELSLKSVVTGLIEQCIQIITNAIKKIPGNTISHGPDLNINEAVWDDLTENETQAANIQRRALKPRKLSIFGLSSSLAVFCPV